MLNFDKTFLFFLNKGVRRACGYDNNLYFWLENDYPHPSIVTAKSKTLPADLLCTFLTWKATESRLVCKWSECPWYIWGRHSRTLKSVQFLHGWSLTLWNAKLSGQLAESQCEVKQKQKPHWECAPQAGIIWSFMCFLHFHNTESPAGKMKKPTKTGCSIRASSYDTHSEAGICSATCLNMLCTLSGLYETLSSHCTRTLCQTSCSFTTCLIHFKWKKCFLVYFEEFLFHILPLTFIFNENCSFRFFQFWSTLLCHTMRGITVAIVLYRFGIHKDAVHTHDLHMNRFQLILFKLESFDVYEKSTALFPFPLLFNYSEPVLQLYICSWCPSDQDGNMWALVSWKILLSH